jgi:hypothetical protein
MLREKSGVTIPELVEQARRPFDVGEEEGDGAAREVPHRRRIAPATVAVNS